MELHNCKTIVFSSSATVYGIANNKLLTEDSYIKPSNAYGQTKLLSRKF